MKNALLVSFIIFLSAVNLKAQNTSILRYADSLLLKEEYRKVIDTCSINLKTDSLNPWLFYKTGVAWLNQTDDKKAIWYFKKAAELDTINPLFRFRLARSYYADDKIRLSEPLFRKLLSADTLNWSYAFYLTAILMQTGKYDQALSIYNRFLKTDSSDCTYLDKTAFAYLRKGDFENSMKLFNKSLSINSNNTSVLKNLSYLYASTSRWDTAVAILGMGMKLDTSDMDLYARRAQLYFLKDYTKRAMDDYLVIIASGDSSKLYLKRVGIGYSYNLQPAKALPYLLLAYKSDSTDYETCSYLAQCYGRTGDAQNSVLYYRKASKILLPLYIQLGRTYFLGAQSMQEAKTYKDAIDYYKRANEIDHNINTLMIIANLYDETLNDRTNAIKYYRLFLERINGSEIAYPQEYIGNIRKRLEYLEKKPAGKI